MKTLLILIWVLCLPLLSINAQISDQASSEELQEWIALDKETTRAKYEDNVLVVIITVKEEAKKDFDLWIRDILYKALNNTKSEMKMAQLKATRWLEPLNQNPDGTWTYSWFMDPMIPKTNYDILPFLKKEYGEEMANKYWEKYLSFMAKPAQGFILKQSNF